MGLFENPYTKINDYSKEKHRESAKKTAVESMVMLKNNNALPLSTDEKICVMGDISLNKRTILGSWTLDYDIDESVTVFDSINNATQNAFYYDYNSPEGNVLRRAYTTDTAIVVIGESASLTGEANSIANIELSESQKEMIRFARKRFKKVVGLFAFGRPRAFEDVVDDLDAIIYLWHSGSQTGNAIADILFGKA
ncbi:MAG: glycoside hydrolase family 3 C-terminal domain-containing protein, partial [Prevotella sp.]|nr:glycoside hydrolase family 3 C-terminal domain-containing protein [Prevotella sp.]